MHWDPFSPAILALLRLPKKWRPQLPVIKFRLPNNIETWVKNVWPNFAGQLADLVARRVPKFPKPCYVKLQTRCRKRGELTENQWNRFKLFNFSQLFTKNGPEQYLATSEWQLANSEDGFLRIASRCPPSPVCTRGSLERIIVGCLQKKF